MGAAAVADPSSRVELSSWQGLSPGWAEWVAFGSVEASFYVVGAMRELDEVIMGIRDCVREWGGVGVEG